MLVSRRLKNFNSLLCSLEFETLLPGQNRRKPKLSVTEYFTNRTEFVNSRSALSQLFHAEVLGGLSP